MCLQFYAAVYQRLYTLAEISVRVRAAEYLMAENESIISLTCARTWIYRVKYIRLRDDNITLAGCEFLLAADKFSRAPADIIQLKFIVPMHWYAAEIVGDNALIIAERLYLAAVYAVFL